MFGHLVNKSVIVAAVLFSFQTQAMPIQDKPEDFPDALSRQVFNNFLIDSKAYGSENKIFTAYGKETNSSHLPCSLNPYDINSTPITYPTFSQVKQCIQDELKEGGWLIIGDSHGGNLFRALKSAYPKQNIAMMLQWSCAPARSPKFSDNSNDKTICFNSMPQIIEWINSDMTIKKVLFAARYTDERGFGQFITDIRKGLYKKDLIIFNAGPKLVNGPMSYLKEQGFKDRYLLPEAAKVKVRTVNDALETLAAPKVKLFNKYALFCDVNDACRIISDDLHSFFHDDSSHLQTFGFLFYGEQIKKSKILE